MSGLLDWVLAWAQSPYAPGALFFIAFAESSFFPVPPDILLISLALLKPETAFFLALICSAGSVIGGMFGYFLGWMGGRPLLHKLFSEEKIGVVKKAFEKHEVWAIAVAGFTPVPYKVFTLSAGSFDVPFRPFLVASAISRSARFFLVGAVIHFWGERVRYLIEDYFNWFSLVFMTLLIGGFVVANHVVKRHGAKDIER